MSIVRELEKVIAQLPVEQASSLRFWLNEYQSARRYKHTKSYAMANQALDDFEQSNGNALWN